MSFATAHTPTQPAVGSFSAESASGSVTALHQGPMHTSGVLLAFSGSGADLAAELDADRQKTLRRLAEIGFLPGEVVRVVARGWLRGGPIAVRVGQSTFALRPHEAGLLQVRWGAGA